MKPASFYQHVLSDSLADCFKVLFTPYSFHETALSRSYLGKVSGVFR